MGHALEVFGLAQNRGQDARSPQLFSDVSFRWESPGLHILMGPSGGGKSSLLKTLGGVWRPQSGRVEIDGENLWTRSGELNPRLLPRLGFAFQNNALFSSLRVIENLTFPHRQRSAEMTEKARTALAQEWLARVGLDHVAFAFPHELSGGMQKRLAIARTLILAPDFIFLDDPTAGLDPITSQQMAELVDTLLKGTQALVVIVTNDPDRARDWGPNVHYLIEGVLLSPPSSSSGLSGGPSGSPSPEYLQAQETFA